MATSHFFLSLCALLLAVSLNGAFGLIIDRNRVSEVRVAGQLACSTTGNPLLGRLSSPLVGADVRIVCNDGGVTLGQALTDLSGTVSMVYRMLDGVMFDSSTCVVRVPLVDNVLSCSVLPPTGNLRATLVFTRLVQNPGGEVAAVFNISPFVLLV